MHSATFQPPMGKGAEGLRAGGNRSDTISSVADGARHANDDGELPMRIAALALLATSIAAPALAGSVHKSVPFALHQWVELGSEEGPVTLHRFRIEKKSGGLTKSKLFRPGNSEFLETIQLQLEYSNRSSHDWKAHLKIVWKDSKGRVIDGYVDKESLDDGESWDKATVTLSTLRYGLERAQTLEIEIEYDRD